MEISAAPKPEMMTELLKQALEAPQKVTEDLMRLNVQNTIDLQQLDTMGKFISMYV